MICMIVTDFSPYKTYHGISTPNQCVRGYQCSLFRALNWPTTIFGHKKIAKDGFEPPTLRV